MRGLSIEAAVTETGRSVPVALCAEDRAHRFDPRGLSMIEMIEACYRASDSGGDLVCYGVDYLASLLFTDAGYDDVRALWRGDKVRFGGYLVSMIPNLRVWLYHVESKRSVQIIDVRRWGADTLPESCVLYGVDAPVYAERWKISDPGAALSLCECMAATYGDLGRAVVDACVRAGLPLYWRDGPGRVASHLLKGMATKDDIAPYPAILDKPIKTAFFGGRIQVCSVGTFDHVTQYDIRSAYPAAMSELPSLDGASWRRVRSYDPESRWAVWRVDWNVPHGARIGPFPLREDGRVTYPLSGSGWHWASEVTAAIEVYGSSIVPRDGVVLTPRDARRPFEGIRGHYDHRAYLRDSGDLSASHVLKLTLTAMYGKLAQAMLPDGSPGKWSNLALAGIVTSETRARVLRMAADYWNDVAAICTDSITLRTGVSGDPAGYGRALGDLSLEVGDRAILLPSGAYHVDSINGRPMDRISGLDRNRSRVIDWQTVRQSWELLGIAAHHHIGVPLFVGIGLAANGRHNEYGSWRFTRRDIVGGSYIYKARRVGWRTWDIFPPPGAGESGAYVPRSAVLNRMPDQSGVDLSDVIEEQAIPH